jgi:phosphatidylserine/phosphatidylglycerophosphate/cardiolipin synthase-like enzyme
LRLLQKEGGKEMNWFKRLLAKNQQAPELFSSTLYNEITFYKRFIADLYQAEEEVIIESPFISTKRLTKLVPVFEMLIKRNIQVCIITRDPLENDSGMAENAEKGIRYFEKLGVQVLIIKGGHHRKLAMIDREILWEGSLNILSQSNSREFMRRLESKELTDDLFKFLQFDRFNLFKKKLTLV